MTDILECVDWQMCWLTEDVELVALMAVSHVDCLSLQLSVLHLQTSRDII